MKNRIPIDNISFKKLLEKKDTLTMIESLPYSENLKSVMDTSIHTCSPEQLVKQVAKEMSSQGISSIIVVNEEKQPVGIEAAWIVAAVREVGDPDELGLRDGLGLAEREALHHGLIGLDLDDE